MKTCPQCQSHYPEDYVFCMNDGTTLKDEETEQETILQNKVLFGEKTSALSPGMLVVCPSCGLANRSQSKFCKKCGTLLFAENGSAPENNLSAPTPQNSASFNFQPIENLPNSAEVNQFVPFTFPSLQNPSPQILQHQPQNLNETAVWQTPHFAPPNTSGQNPAAQPKTNPNKTVFLIAGVLFGAVILGAVIWFINQPNPLEAKLDKAINGNNLFEPAGDNAYEFYQKLKSQGVGAEILKKYDDRIFPMLTEKPDEVLKTVTEIGVAEKNLDEWQKAAKMLEWASEMRPADSQIAAKAAYCKGRVNYINENKQAAIEDWQKAADLDKKWALPANGVGLIYNEQKNYEAAKPWFRQAIDRQPTWAIPYNNLGTAFYYQKRYDEAVRYYRKAIEFAPRWARPHAWLGSIAEENYDYSTCVSEFNAVLSPDAVGSSELSNLETIRRKKQKCENQAAYYYEE